MELLNLTQQEKRQYSTKDVSKLVKKQLKEEFPLCKFSVRCHYFSMGSSLSVTLFESNIKVIKNFEDISEEALAYFDNRDNYTREQIKKLQESENHQINQYSFNDDYDKDKWNNGVFLTEKGYNLLKRICKIVQQYNYDNSEPITDYFDVNFYFDLSIGEYDKPFKDGLK